MDTSLIMHPIATRSEVLCIQNIQTDLPVDGVPIELPRREGCEGLWVLKLPVWLWQ